MGFTPRIIKKIAKANLIGRGCNNFPVVKKWQMVREAKAKIKYVIANISESEPGVFKDKHILQNWPELVMGGMKIAMRVVGAKQGFIYLNPEYYAEFQGKLNEIIKAKKLAIELYEKPQHDYVGGEETALINSIEGKRVEPRLKPPFPTLKGFENCPTLINNCETFYAVALIKSGKYKNTRFYSCSEFKNGKYEQQQVKELPVEITIKKALQEFGHKPSDKYFYQVGGGASGACLNAKQLNRLFSGLAAVVVYQKETSEKEVVMHWAEFFKHESCGQCVPCREGTYRLYEILEKHYLTGDFNKELFDHLNYTMQNTSFCPVGRVAASALLSYWKNVLAVNNKQLTINK